MLQLRHTFRLYRGPSKGSRARPFLGSRGSRLKIECQKAKAEEKPKGCIFYCFDFSCLEVKREWMLL